MFEREQVEAADKVMALLSQARALSRSSYTTDRCDAVERIVRLDLLSEVVESMDADAFWEFHSITSVLVADPSRSVRTALLTYLSDHEDVADLCSWLELKRTLDR